MQLVSRLALLALAALLAGGPSLASASDSCALPCCEPPPCHASVANADDGGDCGACDCEMTPYDDTGNSDAAAFASPAKRKFDAPDLAIFTPAAATWDARAPRRALPRAASPPAVSPLRRSVVLRS